MLIRVEGVDLPGARSPEARERYAAARVGIQRGSSVEQLHPADARSVSWVVECRAVVRDDGAVDVLGPYVHGRPGDRFLYLSWGSLDGTGGFATDRRAKLMLAAVDAAVLAAAAQDGSVLVARLGLTGSDGTPLCAAVRPPAVTWSAEPP